MSPRMFFAVLLVASLFAAATIPAQSSGETVSNDSTAKITALLKERREVLAQRLEIIEYKAKSAKVSTTAVFDARDDLIAADIDLAATAEERIKLLKSRVANLKEAEEFYRALKQRAAADESDILTAKSRRLLAEVELERALDN